MKGVLPLIWGICYSSAFTFPKWIKLSNPNIRELNKLQEYDNLEFLEIRDMDSDELGPISGCTNLARLHIQNTKISDITPIEDCIDIESLYLTSSPVEDISSIEKCKKLKFLDLTQTLVKDVSSVNECPDLLELHLGSSKVTGLSGLKNCTKLKKLNIRDTLVKDLNPISGFTNIREIDLSGTMVEDITPLVNCSKLEKVELSGSNVGFYDNEQLAMSIMESLKKYPDTPLENKLKVWDDVLIPALRDSDKLDFKCDKESSKCGVQDLLEVSAINLGIKSEMIAKFDTYTLTSPFKDHNYYEKIVETEKRFKKYGYHSVALGNKETQDKGLYVFALVKQNYSEDEPVIITCAGTMGDYRLVHDLDPMGPGYEIYNKFSDIILLQINNLCSTLNCKNILVTGHSLGGSHAQYIVDDMLCKKTSYLINKYSDSKIKNFNDDYQHIAELKTINAVTFQSAGINKNKIRRSNILISKLNNIKNRIPEHEKFRVNFVPHINGGDIVPYLDGGYLFSDLQSTSKIVKRIYIEKVNKPAIESSDLVLMASSIVSTEIDQSFAKLIFSYSLLRKLSFHVINSHKEFFYQNSSRQEEANIDDRIKIHTPNNPSSLKLIKKFSPKEKKIVEQVPGLIYLREKIYNCTKDLSNQDIRTICMVMQFIQNTASFPIQLVEAGINPDKTKNMLQSKMSGILSFFKGADKKENNTSSNFTIS